MLRYLIGELLRCLQHLRQYRDLRPHFDAIGAPDWMVAALEPAVGVLDVSEKDWRRRSQRLAERITANLIGEKLDTLQRWLRPSERGLHLLRETERIVRHHIKPAEPNAKQDKAAEKRWKEADKYAERVFLAELKAGRFDRMNETCDEKDGEPCDVYLREGCCRHLMGPPIINLPPT